MCWMLYAEVWMRKKRHDIISNDWFGECGCLSVRFLSRQSMNRDGWLKNYGNFFIGLLFQWKLRGIGLLFWCF
jgi:hypothetical protein